MSQTIQKVIIICFTVHTAPLQVKGGDSDLMKCVSRHTTEEYYCYESQLVTKNWDTRENSKIQEFQAPTIQFDRVLYFFKSYPLATRKGFYTGLDCKTNVDHVVSLRDAHYSGGLMWPPKLRKEFANDRLNHVAACSEINSSKGASTPSGFIRKSNDGKGLDYIIETRCAYLDIYYQVKVKYSLSFANNNLVLFKECGI